MSYVPAWSSRIERSGSAAFASGLCPALAVAKPHGKVRALRFELRTSTLSGWRSNQLSYARKKATKRVPQTPPTVYPPRLIPGKYLILKSSRRSVNPARKLSRDGTDAPIDGSLLVRVSVDVPLYLGPTRGDLSDVAPIKSPQISCRPSSRRSRRGSGGRRVPVPQKNHGPRAIQGPWWLSIKSRFERRLVGPQIVQSSLTRSAEDTVC